MTAVRRRRPLPAGGAALSSPLPGALFLVTAMKIREVGAAGCAAASLPVRAYAFQPTPASEELFPGQRPYLFARFWGQPGNPGAARELNGYVANIEDFRKLVAGDHGLVVVSALRNDGTITSSVVNAGVLPHPLTGETVIGMVVQGGARKLASWRERPYANVVIRSGWQWAAAEGRVDLIGPDDPDPGVDAERLRLLLREVFTAAGGTHDDFGTYDRVMREERRAVVLVHPERVYSNRGQ